jgi:hypothetical protein
MHAYLVFPAIDSDSPLKDLFEPGRDLQLKQTGAEVMFSKNDPEALSDLIKEHGRDLKFVHLGLVKEVLGDVSHVRVKRTTGKPI